MCISLLGGAKVRFRQGVRRPKFRQVGSMLAHFSLLSASWVHFSRLAAFVAPFGRFFRDLGRSSLDFGAPSWPYVGTHFALDGIFRHAARIPAKKTLLAFTFCFSFPQCSAAVRAQHMESPKIAQEAKQMVFWVLLAHVFFGRFGMGFGWILRWVLKGFWKDF